MIRDTDRSNKSRVLTVGEPAVFGEQLRDKRAALVQDVSQARVSAAGDLTLVPMTLVVQLWYQ